MKLYTVGAYNIMQPIADTADHHIFELSIAIVYKAFLTGFFCFVAECQIIADHYIIPI
mgnify:CR=1 FL=1